ncbi:MAG: hypothetical protein ACKVOK_05645 [Flavobacteriales bacterium]
MNTKAYVFFLLVLAGILGCDNGTDSSVTPGEEQRMQMSDPAVQISGIYADTIEGEKEGEKVFIEVTLNPDSTFTLSRHTITAVPGQPVPVKGARQVINGIYLQKDNWKKIKLSSSGDGGRATSFEILPDALKLLDENESTITRAGNFTIRRGTKAIMNVGQYILSYDQKAFSKYPVQVYLRTSGNNIRIHKAYLDQAKNYEKALLAYYALKYNTGCDNAGCAFDVALGMSEDEMKNSVRSTIPDLSDFTNNVLSPTERQRLSMILINKTSTGLQVHSAYLTAKDQNYTVEDEFKIEGDKLKVIKSSGDSKVEKKIIRQFENTFMSQTIQQNEIGTLINRVNTEFNVHLNLEDFKSAGYSRSSLTDILAQKIQDEKNGDWTSDVAFHKLRNAVVKVKGIKPTDVTLETDLNQLFPSSGRKKDIEAIGKELGFELQILKPNAGLYGFFIFAFFAGIPLFSIGWFPAAITMVVSAIVIFILTKSANQFKMKTIGLLADHLAWKNYLKANHESPGVDKSEIIGKLEMLLPQ